MNVSLSDPNQSDVVKVVVITLVALLVIVLIILGLHLYRQVLNMFVAENEALACLFFFSTEKRNDVESLIAVLLCFSSSADSRTVS